MLKTAALVVDRVFRKNIIVDKNQTKIIIRDNVFDKYYKLHDLFMEKDVDLSTSDINSISKSDYVIYVDLPSKLPRGSAIDKSFLIMMESPLVKKNNFIRKYHDSFRKIFTWCDDLVDNKKYFKINYAFKLPDSIPKNLNKPKLICLIVSNKRSSHINELYSERINAIRWFEKHHSDDFDLYGSGWNDYNFSGPKIIRGLNKIPIAKKIMFKLYGNYFPSYRGKVDSKYTTMQNYKFAICYENIKDVPGYVTEKIFDAFFAGCVPIYLGASNVNDIVPDNCFIDRSKFNNYEELYEYIKSMSNDRYLEYLNNIEEFLMSDKGKTFGSHDFANTIVSEVIKC